MTLLALGKWGQTTSAKVCNAFVYTEEGLEDFVYDSNIQIINIFLVNDHTLQLTYKIDNQSIRPNRNANIYLISKITAEARIQLDKLIRSLDKVGAEILYVGKFLMQ